MTHNLALLPRDQRQRMQADLTACRIRWAVAALEPAERQKVGNEMLGRLDADMRALVIERLRVRAGR
jgi:hypothetical protein